MNIRPVIFVSRCLRFARCRWNGEELHSNIVEHFRPHAKLIHTCPEIAIGLGLPRDPVRVVEKGGSRRLLQPETGRDLTGKMLSFSEKYLSKLKNIDAFILKNASPSCGLKNVKIFGSPSQKTARKKGRGIFAGEILKHFPSAIVTDEKQLANPKARELFLKKILRKKMTG